MRTNLLCFIDEKICIIRIYNYFVSGLTFISSGIGTVGKDSGFVRCSVGNTQDWKIMKITKLETNGKETAVAAWMVGKGR